MAKLTIADLKAAREKLNEPPKPFVEVYPLEWKKDKELNELCEARIKNGIGVWAQPFDKDHK